MKSLIRPCAGVAALAFSACSVAGEFYQWDSGPAGSSVVAVKAWDDLKLSASHSRWSKEGRATSAALMKSLPLALPGGVQLAAGVQAIDHRSARDTAVPSDSGLGLNASAEWQPRVGPGQAYVLVERASVFGAWLAVAHSTLTACPSAWSGRRRVTIAGMLAAALPCATPSPNRAGHCAGAGDKTTAGLLSA